MKNSWKKVFRRFFGRFLCLSQIKKRLGISNLGSTDITLQYPHSEQNKLFICITIIKSFEEMIANGIAGIQELVDSKVRLNDSNNKAKTPATK